MNIFKYFWLQFISKNYKNSNIFRTDSKTFAEQFKIQIDDQIVCKKDICFITKKRKLACINFFLSGHLVAVPTDEFTIKKWKTMFTAIKNKMES